MTERHTVYNNVQVEMVKKAYWIMVVISADVLTVDKHLTGVVPSTYGANVTTWDVFNSGYRR